VPLFASYVTVWVPKCSGIPVVTAIYTLVKPIVGILRGTSTTSTLPIGTTVKFFQTGQRIGLVSVESEGQHYSVFLHDLLDALPRG
jgi:hypothetical protein